MNSDINIFANFLTVEECGFILNKCKTELTLKRGEVYSTKLSARNSRKSSIAWATDLDFLNKRLTDILKSIYTINGWEVSGFGDYQFTEYKVGEYYDWHTDSGENVYTNRFTSIVIQLNDGYVGGKLEIKNSKNELVEIEQNIGNLYIFNSNLIHRVTTVESGIRYSLVNWISLNKVKNNDKRELI